LVMGQHERKGLLREDTKRSRRPVVSAEPDVMEIHRAGVGK
jgi:hypothetical protein